MVGKSLKYTQTGYGKIDLNVRRITRDVNQRESSNEFMADLNVADCGKGIGAEFLQKELKLYSSFSQESTLAPGTGKPRYLIALVCG